MKKLITIVFVLSLALLAQPVLAAPACSDDQVWDGKNCVAIATGGAMPFLGRPAVNPWIKPDITFVGDKTIVGFLTTAFAKAEILVSAQPINLTTDSFQQIENPKVLETVSTVYEQDNPLFPKGTTYHPITLSLSKGTWYLVLVSNVDGYKSYSTPLTVVK